MSKTTEKKVWGVANFPVWLARHFAAHCRIKGERVGEVLARVVKEYLEKNKEK